MQSPHINKLGLTANPFRTSSGTDLGFVQGHSISALSSPDHARPSFKSVMGDLVGNVNNTLTKPDALMKDAITTGNVDVHEVMIANAKAELVVNLSAQMTTKIVQAYDRVTQIQI